MAGRTVIGLWAFGGNDAFRNRLKGVRDLTAASNYAWPGILDANGYPTSSPAQTISGGISMPPYIGPWVLKWTGTGRMRLDRGSPGFTVHEGGGFVNGGTGFNLDVLGTNPRVVFSLTTSTVDALSFNFPAGTYSGMANAILCKPEDEDFLDESDGQDAAIFNPDLLSLLEAYNPRIIRPMDFSPANNGNLAMQSYQVPVSALSYNNERWDPQAWVGTISGTDTYECDAAPGTPVSWTHGETFHGQVTNSNTSQTISFDVGGRGAKTALNYQAATPSIGGITANLKITGVYNAELDRILIAGRGIVIHKPIEVLIALANALGKDFWYCFSPYARDEDIAEITALVRDTLDSGLGFWPEYSNEIWNPGAGFLQTIFAQNMGLALGFTSADGRHIYGYYAKRVREIMEIVGDTWGARPGLNRIMAFQAYGPATNTNTYRFQGADLTVANIGVDYANAPNRPIDYVEKLSYATYYHGANAKAFDGQYTGELTELLAAADDYDSGDPAAMESALDWLDADIRVGEGEETLADLESAIYPRWESRANTHGKGVVCYEGGLQIKAPTTGRLTTLGIDTGYSAKIAALYAAYKLDHRCHKLVRDQIDQFMEQPHSEIPAHYIPFGNNQWSLFGDNIYDETPWQGWDAVRLYNNMKRRFVVNWAA